MSVMQNLFDQFWLKIGKTEKVYPVKIKKHRLKGDDIVFEGIDRGRTLKDEQTGEKRFELAGEPFAEGIVNYEDFEKATNGEWVSVLMVNRDKFVPLKTNYNISKETYMDQEELQKFDVDQNALEYVLSVSSFLEWADKHIEQSWKITETEQEKWWQNSTVQSAILFVGMGLFFVISFYGHGELYAKELASNTAALEETMSQALQSGAIGGN